MNRLEHDTLEESRGHPPQGRAPAKRKPRRREEKATPQRIQTRRAAARARRADKVEVLPGPRFGAVIDVGGEDILVGDPEQPWCAPDNDALWEAV